jgi:hypothetical protein
VTTGVRVFFWRRKGAKTIRHRVGLTDLGVWRAGTMYFEGDAVTHDPEDIRRAVCGLWGEICDVLRRSRDTH